MDDRRRRTGLGLLALGGLLGAAWVRRRRGARGGGALSMGDMTRRIAREQDPVQAGSGTIAWQPSGTAGGMSQNEASSDQPLDSRMSQQFHQRERGGERAPR